MRLFAALLFAIVLAGSARAESVLRVAMTLADLPTTTGSPDQGTEGVRFMGFTLYDPLVGWDLSHADRPATLRPMLATSWEVDPADQQRWVFHLRPGVKFHDGSAFNAQAVVWNLDKLLNRASPQFDQAQSAQDLSRIPTVKSYKVIDDLTVEIRTEGPDALLLYGLSWILMSSPQAWEQAGHSWAEVAKHPAGTGPWILEQLVPRQQATLRRNAAYWDSARIPASDKLILRPVPDPATRTAALLSGEVDYIESPAPDTLPRLRAAGMNVVTGPMPHSWPYTPARTPGSPFNDIRVRKAINLAIDREGLVALLGGLARPARGVVQPESPWFGKPEFLPHYDPEAAKRLLAEAGYGPQHPLKLKFLISPSGSGQMVPLPMNEFVQQNLADIGVELSFEVVEWQVLRSRRDAGGAAGQSNRGIDALNNSWNSMDPLGAFLRHVDSRAIPPAGLNWGGINDPVLDGLVDQVKVEFDPTRQDALLARIHERMVDQAMWIFVVHDVNPRVLSPRVRGFVEAQSWFVDFSPIEVR